MADVVKDFVDVNVPTQKERLLKELRKAQTEHGKRKEPYDFKGAMNDIERYEEDYKHSLRRAIQNGQAPPEYTLKLDVKSYGDPKRFELEKEETKSYTTRSGRTFNTVYKEYRCKHHGGRISVETSTTEEK